MLVQQTKLECGTTTLIVWLPVEDNLRVGRRVTLEAYPDEIYTIKELYSAKTDSNTLHAKAKWNVGGL